MRFLGTFLKIMKRENVQKKTINTKGVNSIILLYSFQNIHSCLYATVAEIKILGLLSVSRTKKNRFTTLHDIPLCLLPQLP